MTPSRDIEMADLNNFIKWMLVRIYASDHGCFTGDCLHELECDCVESIRESYYEDSDGEC